LKKRPELSLWTACSPPPDDPYNTAGVFGSTVDS
jgi:hypothetical protein